uniref:Uncharacterized protein n=1 Tax=Cliftonaea pectinata TaxID=2007206 RepID=A0A1Z1MPL6_9FLOR|nr:hypothetical protein [Cliftonaea pectinata]ARW68030.1 hypothetical protein [Cliftonaea pectinata]
MIKYWPNKQSINLNNCVVDLFLNIEKKLYYKLSNKTNYYLQIDILNEKYRNKLFYLILSEFKTLILDLIELNISKQKLLQLNQQIKNHLINKVLKNFILNINSKYKIKSHNFISVEHDKLSYNLMIYLIFGSSHITKNIFLFEEIYTPFKHVQIIFENFIIELSSIIVNYTINNFMNSPTISKLIQYKEICNKYYISNRSIIFFINNLKLQNLIYQYIYMPKYIYSGHQQIWLISSSGLIKKHIFLSRIEEIKKFNQVKIFFLFWLEIKDIIMPKVEKLLLKIIHYLAYISISFLSNIMIIITRVIIFYLNR